jgi:hypothetical protein
MYRYMTQELAEQLLAGGIFAEGGDQRSFRFLDIRSYLDYRVSPPKM